MWVRATNGRFQIDEADSWLVEAFSWSIMTHGRTGKQYVFRARRPSGSVLLHRVLVAVPPGLEVDHANGDSLDNRRANLRLATRSQQMHNRGRPGHNTSGVKGVYFDKQNQRWMSDIETPAGRRRKLHDTKEEATAYLTTLRSRLLGEFANHGEVKC